MILPVYAYGHPVLRKVGIEIEKNYPELNQLIDNMFETMYNASGVGLAAPQVGLSIRLFIVDSTQMESEKSPEFKGVKKAFINATILEEYGDEWAYEEGCLTVPKINGDVIRHEKIKIKYFDEEFNEHIEEFSSLNARVIQHEYDHIEGILFTSKLKPIKRTMIKKKLEKIKKGKVNTDYRMKFVK